MPLLKLDHGPMSTLPGGALNFPPPPSRAAPQQPPQQPERAGRGKLLALGLTRITDPRNRAERDLAPQPFPGRSEDLDPPLLPYRNWAMSTASVEARSNAAHDCTHLDHAEDQIVAVLSAILDVRRAAVVRPRWEGPG